jgi:oligoribonuclease NrnB/cAMP/cGMP phosphodiesterase (DHH superfamily)
MISNRSVAIVLSDVYHVVDINNRLKAGTDVNYIERFSTYRAVNVRFSCNNQSFNVVRFINTFKCTV